MWCDIFTITRQKFDIFYSVSFNFLCWSFFLKKWKYLKKNLQLLLLCFFILLILKSENSKTFKYRIKFKEKNIFLIEIDAILLFKFKSEVEVDLKIENGSVKWWCQSLIYLNRSHRPFVWFWPPNIFFLFHLCNQNIEYEKGQNSSYCWTNRLWFLLYYILEKINK